MSVGPLRRGDVWWVGAPLVVPCTTTIRGVESEVELGPQDGMNRQCVANTAMARVVDRSRLDRLSCSLPEPRLDELCGALLWFTGC